MRVIAPPSTITADFAFSTNVAQQYHQITDKYLHYDELRHRIRGKEELDNLWQMIRLTRNVSAQQLALLSLPNEPQVPSINTTGLIQRSCSIVDRLTSSAAESERYQQFNAGDYLMAELIASESIASSQLEGAATTSRVALEMIKIGRAPRDESERMIMGNYRMMEFVANNAQADINLYAFCALHNIAIAGINNEKYRPGEFRCEEDKVVVTDLEGNVIHTPPPAGQIHARLEQLCQFISTPHETFIDENYLHPLVKASIIHFMIGYLHPFRDGNGRTARALFYWYMLRCGYTAFRYISISKLLKNAPTQYIKSYLYTETDSMDLTYFVNYQCEIVARAVQEYIDYIQNLIKTREQLNSWLYQSGLFSQLNTRQRDLALMAVNQPGVLFSAVEVADRLGVSENTARDDLKKLVQLGMMSTLKEGKGNLYTSPKNIHDLQKWANIQKAPTRTQDW